MARKEEVKAFLPDHRKNRSKWMIVFRGRISPPLLSLVFTSSRHNAHSKGEFFVGRISSLNFLTDRSHARPLENLALFYYIRVVAWYNIDKIPSRG